MSYQTLKLDLEQTDKCTQINMPIYGLVWHLIMS